MKSLLNIFLLFVIAKSLKSSAHFFFKNKCCIKNKYRIELNLWQKFSLSLSLSQLRSVSHSSLHKKENAQFACYVRRRGRPIVYSALSASSLYETHNNVKVDQKAKPHIEKETEEATKVCKRSLPYLKMQAANDMLDIEVLAFFQEILSTSRCSIFTTCTLKVPHIIHYFCTNCKSLLCKLKE